MKATTAKEARLLCHTLVSVLSQRSTRPSAMRCRVLLLVLWAMSAWGGLINRTIDDQYGDEVTGLQVRAAVTYLSSVAVVIG